MRFPTSKRGQRFCFFSTILIILAVIVPTATVLNAQGINNRHYEENHEFDEARDFVTIAVNVTSLQTSTLTSNLHLNIPAPGFPFTLSANSKSVNFSAQDFNPQADMSLAITQSSSSRYPFDSYLIEGTLLVKNASGNIRTYVYLDGTIDNWYLRSSELEDITDPGFENYVHITLYYRRGYVVILFAIFVGILMWLLSLSAFTLSSMIWLRKRTVEPPTIAVVGSLLFALPGMRNVVPGNPQVGCTFDIASFFWALLLVAISVMMLMWNYVTMQRSEKKVDSSFSIAQTIME